MYRVTKTIHIRLLGNRSVVLQAGPRGTLEAPDGHLINLDQALKDALPLGILAQLITDGVVVEE